MGTTALNKKLFLGDHLQNGSPYPIGPLSVWSACPVLSVTLVYCGQMVGSIKMKVGMVVGFGPDHTVLDVWPGLTPQKGAVLFCSLAILDSRVGHTMDVLSPFISILCHSDWLFYRQSCPWLDVVYPVPHLCTPGSVPCIISFSSQFPCFLTMWP